MSIFFEDEAQLSGTDSGDEGEDLLTSEDLLFLDDEDTQDNSPSFYRAIDRTPPLVTPYSPPPLDRSTEVEPSLPTDLSTTTRKRRTPELLPLDAPIVLDEPAPKKHFRLQSKGIFLTFPQCPYPLDDFFENLKARFNDPQDQIYCSREQHEDGGSRFSCLQACTSPSWKDFSFFYFLNLNLKIKWSTLVSKNATKR